MTTLIRIFKMILFFIIGLALVIAIGTFLVTSLHPAFGGKPTDEQKAAFQKTGYYEDGTFQNLIPTAMDMNFGQSMDVVSRMLRGIPRQTTAQPLPVLKTSLTEADTLTELIWFGHSAFLLKVGERHILLDPMFGNRASPFGFVGTKRFSNGLPIEIEELPHIDLIIFSHDHYDHLDYPTLKKLAGKVDQYIVPLGIGAHLQRWGIDASIIQEMDWWGETTYDGLDLVCAPARHFSGRGLGDRNSTLWASWLIRTDSFSLYFSGDGGYGPHFKEIGEKYGPVDLALMECGQYNELWGQIHMMPEETAQAAKDIQAESFMPIHWGSFALALHAWDDPVVRVSEKAKALQLQMITPRIGEKVLLADPKSADNDWWRDIE